jgi:flagellar assembly factor FliW
MITFTPVVSSRTEVPLVLSSLDKTQYVNRPQVSEVASGSIRYPSLSFPEGIMGFPHFRHLDIMYNAEELPFMHLVDTQGSSIAFIVIEPNGLVPAYKLEIADPDVLFLQINKPEEILVLNIVTLYDLPGGRKKVTANLIGPLVVNRLTGKGKQVVINNYADYSSHYVLFDNKAE